MFRLQRREREREGEENFQLCQDNAKNIASFNSVKLTCYLSIRISAEAAGHLRQLEYLDA